MLVPQAMAYAMLAGLPPVVGLYASLLPIALYALLGTSRQLAVGPVAMISLMVASALGAVPGADTPTRIVLAAALAGLVGAIQVGLGLARLGFLVRLLSHPVISGFTSAAALLIASSQIKHVLGVKLPDTHPLHEWLWATWESLPNANVGALAIGIGSAAILLVMRRFAPRIPSALLVVVASTALVALTGLDVKTVGEVPDGLPGFSVPTPTLSHLSALAPSALMIAFVGFLESISVGKAFAARNGYRLDADQELVALGVANLGAATTGGLPVTGGFSRTAVNAQAGARTPLASAITAAVVAFALLTLTPLFVWLPNAALAGVVIAAVVQLVDVHEVVHLARTHRGDLAQLLVTFVATLTLGVELGIGLGVGFALIQVLVRSAQPVTARLGRIPGTHEWRDAARIPGLELPVGVSVVRIDARLYFANVAVLERAIEGCPPGSVVIDGSAINDVDTSATGILHELARSVRSRGGQLALARCKAQVRDRLHAAHLPEDLPLFATVDEAVAALSPDPAARAAS
jgi:SulP family sulfate permease